MPTIMAETAETEENTHAYLLTVPSFLGIIFIVPITIVPGVKHE